jgi:AAA+ ATPase superfamily predicted ATPase
MELSEFDIKYLSERPSTVIVKGKHSSGKTRLILDILNKNTDFTSALIIKNEEENRYDSYQHCTVTDQVNGKDIATLINNKSLNDKALIAIDDAIYDNSKLSIPELTNIFSNNNKNTSIVIASSFELAFPEAIKLNTDFIFIFKENILDDLKLLYDNCDGWIPTYDEFDALINQNGNTHSCLVFDNSSNSSNIIDRVFWYKAD